MKARNTVGRLALAGIVPLGLLVALLLGFSTGTSASSPVETPFAIELLQPESVTIGGNVTTRLVITSSAYYTAELVVENPMGVVTTTESWVGDRDWTFYSNWTPSLVGRYTITATARSGESMLVEHKTLQVNDLPVFAIQLIQFPEATANITLTTRVVVTASTGYTLLLQIADPTGRVETQNWPGDRNWTFEYAWTPTLAGTYTVTATVKSGERILTQSKTLEVKKIWKLMFPIIMAQRELAVQLIQPVMATADVTLTTQVVVTASVYYSLSLQISDPAGRIETQNWPGDRNWTFEYAWAPTLAGTYHLTATVTAGNEVKVAHATMVVTRTWRLLFPLVAAYRDFSVTLTQPETAVAGESVTTNVVVSGSTGYTVELVITGPTGIVATQSWAGDRSWTWGLAWTPALTGVYQTTVTVKSGEVTKVLRATTEVR